MYDGSGGSWGCATKAMARSAVVDFLGWGEDRSIFVQLLTNRSYGKKPVFRSPAFNQSALDAWPLALASNLSPFGFGPPNSEVEFSRSHSLRTFLFDIPKLLLHPI